MAPLRIGLSGGGTDVSPFKDNFGGEVINVTISLYINCTIEINNSNRINFISLDKNITNSYKLCKSINIRKSLELHVEVYNEINRLFNINPKNGFNLYTSSSIPPGSGLGSSSTLVVAMIEAYRRWYNLKITNYDIARIAYKIERINLNFKGGMQDQYAAAFGGLNHIKFYKNGKVKVNKINVNKNILNELETNIFLLYTNKSRDSGNIIKEQIKNVQNLDSKAISSTKSLKDDVKLIRKFILKGDMKNFGKIIGKSWDSKKKIANCISNLFIDNIFKKINSKKIYGAKVSGAGGGGFISIVADPTIEFQIKNILSDMNVHFVDFKFDPEGVRSWIPNK